MALVGVDDVRAVIESVLKGDARVAAFHAVALTTAKYFTPSGRSIQKQLHGGQLDAATSVPQGPYKTDSGRQVKGGGGIQPDVAVLHRKFAPAQQIGQPYTIGQPAVTMAL